MDGNCPGEDGWCRRDLFLFSQGDAEVLSRGNLDGLGKFLGDTPGIVHQTGCCAGAFDGMEFVSNMPFEEAIKQLGKRSPVGSMLRSAEWSRIPVGLRERAFFSATVEDLRWLQQRQTFLQNFLSGHTSVNDKGERYFTAGSRAKFIEEAQRDAIRAGLGPLDPNDK